MAVSHRKDSGGTRVYSNELSNKKLFICCLVSGSLSVSICLLSCPINKTDFSFKMGNYFISCLFRMGLLAARNRLAFTWLGHCSESLLQCWEEAVLRSVKLLFETLCLTYCQLPSKRPLSKALLYKEGSSTFFTFVWLGEIQWLLSSLHRGICHMTVCAIFSATIFKNTLTPLFKK